MRIWLKNIRKNKKLTQIEVAKMTYVDVTMISKLELGRRDPSVKLAKKIAEVLDFDWEQFYEDQETI